jgi:hypothetical protein
VRFSTARIRPSSSSRLKGFGDVVVPASVEALDTIRHLVPGGQEDHRNLGTAVTHPAERLEPVAVGQHHVEQDKIRPGRRGDPHRLGAARGRHHLEPRQTERPGQQFQDRRLVVHDQQAGRRCCGSIDPGYDLDLSGCRLRAGGLLQDCSGLVRSVLSDGDSVPRVLEVTSRSHDELQPHLNG